MSATSFGLQRQTFRAREQNAKMKIAHKTYTQYVMLHKTGARLKRYVSAITEVLAFLRCMARGEYRALRSPRIRARRRKCLLPWVRLEPHGT